jgi:hypothetical protein
MYKKMIVVALALTLGLISSASAATIIWVSDAYDDNADGTPDDQGWIDMLQAHGYTVDLSFRNQEARTLDDTKIAALNAAGLIIVSRNSNSGDYASDATEVTQWNSITAPLMLQAMHIARNSRWLWVNSATIATLTAPPLQAVLPSHPVFAGVTLDANNQVQVLDGTVGQSSFIGATDVGNGTLIAQTGGTAGTWIAEWQPGVEFYSGAGQFAGGPRMIFVAGTQEAAPTVGRGMYNLTPEGEKLFLNAVNYMLGGGRPKATNPDPANGAVVEDTWVTLNWTPGDFAVSHDVYLGNNFDEVNNAAPDSNTFRGNQTSTFFVAGFPGFPYPDGLVPGTTYYWRIDEVNDADPNSPWKGDVWSFSIPSKKAYDPNPANGTESVAVTAKLTWTAGFDAKLHTVYFGDDFDTVANATGGLPQGTTTYTPSGLEMAKTYYWRVDEFDGTDTYKGDVWSFTTQGAVGGPNPANGAVDVKPTTLLTWTAGAIAASHEVYFGTDPNAVKNATKTSPAYKGPKALGDESYDPGKLQLETSYYWRIDEVNAANPDGPWKGNVWSFTTGDFYVIDDFESYTDNDTANEAIWQTWVDGFGIADNGAQVGYLLPPYAEQTIVHSGTQSMPLLYNNTGGVTNSEASLAMTVQRDWTEDGVANLSLWFRGNPGSVGSFVEGPVGTYTMTATGADIWGTADQFHFAYKMLSGVGSIEAQVLSVDNTDPWAKAGVMIRETLDAGSKFAAVYITPGNGCRFQARTDTDIAATSDSAVVTTQQTAITAPYRVKLERDVAGNFKGYYSSDGTTWIPMSWNPQSIAMGSNIYVGLAVTAHNANATCTAKFSNVKITGTVGPQWADQDIGIASNASEPLYVAVSNSAGSPAIVTNPDPNAATTTTWTQWVIPLSAFSDQGINLSNVDKFAIGLGTKGDATAAGGSGTMYFDDIRLYQPTTAP